MTDQINALQVIKWLAVIVVIVTLAWYALGQSPTFEQAILMAVTGVFHVPSY